MGHHPRHIQYNRWTCVNKQYYPESTVFIRDHSLCHIFYRFGQQYNDTCPLFYFTEQFYCAKTSFDLPFHPYFSLAITVTYIILLYSEYHCWNHSINFSYRFLSLNNMHLKFCHVFLFYYIIIIIIIIMSILSF